MSIEDFHQLVLFHIMDYPMPEWVQWVSIDEDGSMDGWQLKPVVRKNGLVWDGTGTTYNESHRSVRLCSPPKVKVLPPREGVTCLSFPKGINWTECVFKYEQ